MRTRVERLAVLTLSFGCAFGGMVAYSLLLQPEATKLATTRAAATAVLSSDTSWEVTRRASGQEHQPDSGSRARQ